METSSECMPTPDHKELLHLVITVSNFKIAESTAL